MKHAKISGGAPCGAWTPELPVAEVAFDRGPALAEWAHFSDPLGEGDRIIQALSRAAGLCALSGCAGVAWFVLARIF